MVPWLLAYPSALVSEGLWGLVAWWLPVAGGGEDRGREGGENLCPGAMEVQSSSSMLWFGGGWGGSAGLSKSETRIRTNTCARGPAAEKGSEGREGREGGGPVKKARR
jgi:hypothetical protein